MTAKGLFLALAKFPDAVHVLEDMERLTQDRDAQGVLRSALWAHPGRDRVATWTSATGGEESFVFRGGIILIANRPLAALPELRALATRISVLRLDVTDAEATALMLDLAARGYQIDGKLALAADDCLMVTEHLIAECHAAGCPLDMRLQVNSYSDYRLWEADRSSCDWQDLVTSRVRQAADHFHADPEHRSPEERRAERRKVFREVVAATNDVGEQERLYKERTGRSRTDFYRRKREIESGEFDPEEG
jgi:hypothetical protein